MARSHFCSGMAAAALICAAAHGDTLTWVGSGGVNQRVRHIYLPTGADGAYVRQRVGRYGSSQSAAPAGNQLDAYFEGPGTLTSAGEFDGTALIFK